MPNTNTTNPLWEKQEQYVDPILKQATDIYNTGAPEYYPGSTVADLAPVTIQGLNTGVDAAVGAQTDIANANTNLLTGILSGDDAATQRLAQQAAAATGSPFGGAGTFGGARHAQAATGAAADAIAARQLQASGLASNAQGVAAQPGITLTDIGSVTQDHEQAKLDADKAKYDYNANQPYNWLNQYKDALSFSGTSPGTNTTNSPTALETVVGIGSVLGGAFGLAEGGEVTPSSNYEWKMVDGRYQLVPVTQATPVNEVVEPTNTNYIPTPINVEPDVITEEEQRIKEMTEGKEGIPDHVELNPDGSIAHNDPGRNISTIGLDGDLQDTHSYSKFSQGDSFKGKDFTKAPGVGGIIGDVFKSTTIGKGLNALGVDFGGPKDGNAWSNPTTGATVDVGYGDWQVDPSLAEKAGYTVQGNTHTKGIKSFFTDRPGLSKDVTPTATTTPTTTAPTTSTPQNDGPGDGPDYSAQGDWGGASFDGHGGVSGLNQGGEVGSWEQIIRSLGVR